MSPALNFLSRGLSDINHLFFTIAGYLRVAGQTCWSPPWRTCKSCWATGLYTGQPSPLLWLHPALYFPFTQPCFFIQSLGVLTTNTSWMLVCAQYILLKKPTNAVHLSVTAQAWSCFNFPYSASKEIAVEND